MVGYETSRADNRSAVQTRLLLTVWFIVAGCAVPGVSWAEVPALTLEPGDRLLIDIIRDPDLGREVTIAADGTIRLPYTDPIVVSGMTPEQAERRVADAMAAGVGIDRASVFLDVVARAPVAVIAGNSGSGPIEYRPGMTVMTAVSSFSAIDVIDGMKSPIELMEVARKPFDRAQIVEQLALALLQKARSEAERDGGDILVDASLSNLLPEARLQALLQQEQEILVARRTAFETQVRAIDERAAAGMKLLERLTAQQDIQERRVLLLREELERVEKLGDSGLTTQRRVNDIRSQLLDAELARIDVIAEIGKADSDLAAVQQVRDSFSSTRAVELSETLARLVHQIQQLNTQLAAIERQIDVVRGGSDRTPNEAEDTSGESSLQIFRDGVAIPAGAGDVLEPGDIVVIQ